MKTIFGHPWHVFEKEQRAEFDAILRRPAAKVQEDRRDDRGGSGEVEWEKPVHEMLEIVLGLLLELVLDHLTAMEGNVRE